MPDSLQPTPTPAPTAQAGHTPTPWAISKNLAHIRLPNGQHETPIEMGNHGVLDVRDGTAQYKANSEFIVQAVNQHAALVAVYEAAEARLEELHWVSGDTELCDICYAEWPTHQTTCIYAPIAAAIAAYKQVRQ